LQRFHPEVHKSFRVDPPDPENEPDHHVNGLGVLAATYRFLALNPSFRLFLLKGNRQSWVTIGLEHSQVEDQKRICKHAARERGWPCDPGPINNDVDA